MKRLRISELMDEYTDDEFFPSGGSVSSPEAIKGRVLATAKVPADKKRMPRRKKLLLSAALAAMMALLLGAGLPFIQHQLVSGELFFQQNADGSKITGLVHYGPPLVELEDGRLFFNQDEGLRVDVTDLISDEAPYIFDGSDPDSGKTYYIIAGGTPEYYGYLEWIVAPNPFDYGDYPQPSAAFDENGPRLTTSYAFTGVSRENGEIHYGSLSSDDGTVQVEDEMYQPWLLAGMAQIGIPYADPSEAESEGSYVLE